MADAGPCRVRVLVFVRRRTPERVLPEAALSTRVRSASQQQDGHLNSYSRLNTTSRTAGRASTLSRPRMLARSGRKEGPHALWLTGLDVCPLRAGIVLRSTTLAPLRQARSLLGPSYAAPSRQCAWRFRGPRQRTGTGHVRPDCRHAQWWGWSCWIAPRSTAPRKEK